MVSIQPLFLFHMPVPTIHSHAPNERRIPCDVRVQYVFTNAQSLGQECNTSQRVSACLLDAPVHADHHCESSLF